MIVSACTSCIIYDNFPYQSAHLVLFSLTSKQYRVLFSLPYVRKAKCIMKCQCSHHWKLCAVRVSD